MADRIDECTKKRCKWTGTDDQKDRKINLLDTRRLGVQITDLICPDCGNREFYEAKS